MEYFLFKRQYEKDFVYKYIINNREETYFKVLEEKEDTVLIIELKTTLYKEETDQKTGINYKRFLIKKCETVGEQKEIKKLDVKQDRFIHDEGHFIREDYYTNIDMWTYQKDNLWETCKK